MPKKVGTNFTLCSENFGLFVHSMMQDVKSPKTVWQTQLLLNEGRDKLQLTVIGVPRKVLETHEAIPQLSQ